MRRTNTKFKLITASLLTIILINYAAPLLLTMFKVQAAPAENTTSAQPQEFKAYERTDLRTEFSKTYQTGSNTFKQEYTLDRMHYKSGSNWVDVNNNIIFAPQGKFTYKNAANNFIFRGSEYLNGGVYYQKGNQTCEYGLDSIDGVVLNNSRAVINGNILKYPEIYSGADLIFSITNDGVKAEVVAKNQAALKKEYVFKLTNCKNVQFDKASMSEGNDFAFVNEHKITEDGIEKLVITPDYSKLGTITGEVKIDPSITEGPAVDIFTSQYVKNGHERRYLAVGDFYDTSNGGNYHGRAESYLRFPLNLPSGAIVLYSQLDLVRYNTYQSFDARIGRLNQGIDQWTGENFNDFKSRSGDYSRVWVDWNNYDFKTFSWNLTTLVKEWTTGTTNHGLAIYSNDGTYRGAAFCSTRDDGFCRYEHEPKLYIEYIINQAPDNPEMVTPSNNAIYSGKCDESLSPATGACRTTTKVETRVKVNDPDTQYEADMNYSKFVYRGANNFETGPISGDGWMILYYTGNFVDGVTYWKAQSVDRMNKWNNNSTEFVFTTDTTPPEIPVAIALPEFTKAVGIDSTKQVEPAANPTTDNVSAPTEIFYYIQYSTKEDFSSNVYEYKDVYQQADPTFEIGPKGADHIANTEDDLVDGVKYYFRIKAKDALGNISAYSHIISTEIDGSKPVVTNLTANNLRFSPNSPSSIGIKDTTDISFKYNESHPAKADIEIYDTNNTLVRTISQNISSDTPSSNPTKTFTWDGKDNNGVALADGSYKATVKVYDKADNVSDDSSLILIIDNVGANISISFPENNAWTNQPTIDIKGQVETTALQTFEVKYPNSNTWNNVTYDSVGIFSHNVNLNLGNNAFQFKAIDSTANQTTKNINIKYENTQPIITNVIPDGATNNRKPVIKFTVSDPDNIGDKSQTSTIPFGTNPKGMKIWLTYQTTNGEVTKQLINDGINLDPALISNLICTQNAPINGANCTLNFVNELQPDSTYTIHIEAKDRAGNFTTDEASNFVLDSHVYGEIMTPVNGGIYANNELIFRGRASKDATVEIRNTELNQIKNYKFDGSLNPEQDSFQLSEFMYTCNELFDTDGRSETLDEEICTWEVKLAQSFTNDNIDTINHNTIIFRDNAFNELTLPINTTVNLHKFSLEINADNQYFSPNGDSFQDGVKFKQRVFNATDTLNNIPINSWKLEVKDSNNIVVRQYEGLNSLPYETQFDGKNSEGEWLEDGQYSYTLTATTTFDITQTTEPKFISAKSNLTNEIVITNPASGGVTTYGVITVQGQAPKSTNASNDNNSSGLKGTVTVDICIDTITIPDNNVGCDSFVQNVEVDENGFFSTLVTLPRNTGQTQTEHTITAVAYDEFGNHTPVSNPVQITLDTVNPFNYVSIIPKLTGISTTEDYEKFLNGEIDIDELRTILIRTNVSQNTQGVEMSFADFTNMSFRPENPGYLYMATINNQTEINSSQNPFDNISEKKNHLPLNLDELPNNPCTQAAGCTWEYTYPVTEGMGGIYEVRFRGKKGDILQTMTEGFTVDGTIPPAPIFMVSEKWDEATQTWVKIDEVDYNMFTNTGEIRLRGAAEPGTLLELIGNGDLMGSQVVHDTGIFEFTINLEDYIDHGGPGGGPCTGQCLSGLFNFKLLSWKVDKNKNKIGQPIESELPVTISFDQTAPQIVSINRTTPTGTVNGWLRSGDQAQYTIVSSEPLKYSHLEKEDGFVRVLTSNNTEFNTWVGSFNVNRETEGYYYPEFTIVDLAGNRKDYSAHDWDQLLYGDFRLKVDNTLPDKSEIDKTYWGDELSDGGINADGTVPVLGRTNPHYVISSEFVTIAGKAEYNQRVEIWVNHELNKIIQIDETFGCQSNEVDKLASDGLIVKYGSLCNYEYDFRFTGEGKNDAYGTPLDSYIIQTRVIDSAYNKSDFSEQVIIYDDRQDPAIPEITNASSTSYSPIPFWKSSRLMSVANKFPTTRDNEVILSSYGERNADMEYIVYTPKGELADYIFFMNGGNMSSTQTIKLGSNQSDDRDGCVMTIGLRRVGTCNDGIYSILLHPTDGAGNTGESGLSQIEKDTVKPAKAQIALDMVGLYSIRMRVIGEPDATSSVGVINNAGIMSGIVKNLDPNKDSDWERWYTFCTNLTDRAGNTSEQVCESIKSPVRPPRAGECTNDRAGFEQRMSQVRTDYGQVYYPETTQGHNSLETPNDDAWLWVALLNGNDPEINFSNPDEMTTGSEFTVGDMFQLYVADAQRFCNLDKDGCTPEVQQNVSKLYTNLAYGYSCKHYYYNSLVSNLVTEMQINEIYSCVNAYGTHEIIEYSNEYPDGHSIGFAYDVDEVKNMCKGDVMTDQEYDQLIEGLSEARTTYVEQNKATACMAIQVSSGNSDKQNILSQCNPNNAFTAEELDQVNKSLDRNIASQCMTTEILNGNQNQSDIESKCKVNNAFSGEELTNIQTKLGNQIQEFKDWTIEQNKKQAELEAKSSLLKFIGAVGVIGVGVVCLGSGIVTMGLALGACAVGTSLAVGVSINEAINMGDAFATMQDGFPRDTKANIIQKIGDLIGQPISREKALEMSNTIDDISDLSLAISALLVTSGYALNLFLPSAGELAISVGLGTYGMTQCFEQMENPNGQQCGPLDYIVNGLAIGGAALNIMNAYNAQNKPQTIMTSHEKGKLGEQKTYDKIVQTTSPDKVGKQITIDVTDSNGKVTRIRADWLEKLDDGTYIIHESKYGPTARLTTNQNTVFKMIDNKQSFTFKFVGGNAQGFELSVNTPYNSSQITYKIHNW